MKDIQYLKNNPVFWSRLGFCYDPPLKNSRGEPLVFTENMDPQIEYHREFAKANVKIHTCILHLGWMGVDEYDYSLTDKVLDSVFSCGEDIYFIPRIKLNAPIDWCKENPEEVFVYYGGPKTPDEIAALVGTEKQDYFGYDAPDGYYRSGDYVDKRPNVGGLIARQSFSSEKWKKDANEALERLLDRLENSKYKDRIIGYHIAYGTSGETILWGRISKRYGDYGISNRRAFFNYGLEKYGSVEEMSKAWHRAVNNADTLLLPTPEERYGRTTDLQTFLRGRHEDVICRDYDAFMSETNVSALEYFAKTVKSKTGKLVGAFYGYSLYIDDAAYSGHLGLDRLLASPYIDFLASPKAYARSGIGEPGGEICPAQSINLRKLFVDELDNRTYLATENEADIKSGFVAGGLNDTVTVMRREIAKNLSHDSGFWWMDLGGGWFSSPELMNEISSLVSLNSFIRQRGRESIADMLVVFDEESMLSTRHSSDLHKGFLREFITETNLSGVIADIYSAKDLSRIDLCRYKLIVFAQNVYMSEETRRIIEAVPEEITLAFSYVAGAHGENGFSLERAEKITSHRITATEDVEYIYDFPAISATKIKGGRERSLLFDKPYLKANEIRSVARDAGCHIYCEDEGVTVYGDSRFIAVFNKNGGGALKLPEAGTYTDFVSGIKFCNTDRIPLPKVGGSSLILVKEED